jgi:hypothetical protein
MTAIKKPQAERQGAGSNVDEYPQDTPLKPVCQLKFTLITKSNGPLTKIIPNYAAH